ncbi:hypothetical protein ACFPM7_18985 [Actinokineospora guangxiensis]|uniref:Secreted protein n=1 Tax=Actinokineospora guangxiensis TaxID=1490288 RepID=A0ABW0ESX3_9PSEU
MLKQRLGVATAALIGALAIVGAVWLFGGQEDVRAGDGPPSTPASSTPTSSTPTSSTPLPGPPEARVPGDGPPNHADNRGHLQPRDITPEQEKALGVVAKDVEGALRALPAASRVSPDAVRAALAGLGYGPDRADVVARPDTVSGRERVVYGVSAEGGCVSGGVWADSVQAVVGGPVAEWGCLPPDTH